MSKAGLINGRTPEEIKAGLKFYTKANLPGYGCNVACPYLNTTNRWFHVKRDALALIERLEAERDAALTKVPKWISVEERLPEKWQYADGTFVNYLIYMPKYGVDVGNYIQPAKSWVCIGFPTIVTHWMPLPEPPEKETT